VSDDGAPTGRTVRAVADALPTYARASERGATDGLLQGRPVAPALRSRATPRRRADAAVG
jgi:glutamate-1-semialdehyde 2,1-aminomutase